MQLTYRMGKGRYGRDREGDVTDQKTLTLIDGTYVEVREIQAEDVPALQRLFNRLSEQTVYLRFFGPKGELPEAKARHFAEVDGEDRYALVALDPDEGGEIVAVVRYDREGGTDTAEYAALVEDRMQGRGLGLSLTRFLIEAAREREVRRFNAFVLPENKVMLKMLRSLDLPESVTWEDGLQRVDVDLAPNRAV